MFLHSWYKRFSILACAVSFVFMGKWLCRISTVSWVGNAQQFPDTPFIICPGTLWQSRLSQGLVNVWSKEQSSWPFRQICLQVTQQGRKWYLWVSSIYSQYTRCSGMEFCRCTSIMLGNLATQQGFGLNSHLQAGINVQNSCPCASGSPGTDSLPSLKWSNWFPQRPDVKSLKMVSWSCSGGYVKKCCFRERTVRKESNYKWNSLTSNRHCEQAAWPFQARKQGLN